MQLEDISLNNKTTIPLIKSGYAKIIIHLFSELGFDPHTMIRQSGLPPDLYQLNTEFLPVEPVRRLLYLISNQVGVTKFTDILRLAFRQQMMPDILKNFKQVNTLEDALLSAQECFSTDATNVSVGLEQHLGQRWFCRYAVFEDHPYFLWSEVFSVLYRIELIRILTRSEWMPERVMIQSHQSDIFLSVLDQPVQLFISQDKTALLVSEEMLQAKVTIPPTFLVKPTELVEWHTSFTDSVFTALQPYVKEHVLTVAKAAALLKLTPRTLQRRLGEEHTSFRQLKDSLMFSAACELMANGHSLTYIANQLGYGNLSQFSRAFKRISGITPKLYKNSIL